MKFSFHIKQSIQYKKKILLNIVFLSILSVSVILLSLKQYELSVNKIEYLTESEYEYLYLTNHTVGDENCFYYGNGHFIFKNTSTGDYLNRDDMIKADILIQHSELNYTHNTPKSLREPLKENELILSSNIAKSYNLEVGSKLYLYKSLSKPIEYKVVDIIGKSYGIINQESNKGLIVTGYTPDVLSTVSIKMIYFSNDNPNDFYSNPIVYEDIVNTSEILKTENVKVVLSIVANVVVVLLVFLLLFKFNIKCTKKRYRVICVRGYKRLLLIRNFLLEDVIYLSTSFLLTIILCNCLLFKSDILFFINLLTLTIYTLIILLNTIFTSRSLSSYGNIKIRKS